MKNPDFKLKLVLVALAVSTTVALTARAESPDPGPAKNSPRGRPQVIYHLPPASKYSATLHSQAKGQNNDFPLDGGMPSSLQTPRGNPNAETIREPESRVPSFQQRSERPRFKSNRSQARSRSFAHPKGGGNSHGHKGHKK